MLYCPILSSEILFVIDTDFVRAYCINIRRMRLPIDVCANIHIYIHVYIKCIIIIIIIVLLLLLCF